MALVKIDSFTRMIWNSQDNHVFNATSFFENRCVPHTLNNRKLAMSRAFPMAALAQTGVNMFTNGVHVPSGVPVGKRVVTLYQGDHPNPFWTANVAQCVSAAAGIGAANFDLIVIDFETIFSGPNGSSDPVVRENFAAYMNKLKTDNPSVVLYWYTTFLDIASTTTSRVLRLGAAGRFAATDLGGANHSNNDFSAHMAAHNGTLSLVEWSNWWYNTPITAAGGNMIADLIDGGQIAGIGYDPVAPVVNNDFYSLAYMCFGSLNSFELQKQILPEFPWVLCWHQQETGSTFTQSFVTKNTNGKVRVQEKMRYSPQAIEAMTFMLLWSGGNVLFWEDNKKQHTDWDYWGEHARQTALGNPNIYSDFAWQIVGATGTYPYTIGVDNQDFLSGQQLSSIIRGSDLFSQVQDIADVGVRSTPIYSFRRGVYDSSGNIVWGASTTVTQPINGGHYAYYMQNQYPLVELMTSGSDVAAVIWDVFPISNSELEVTVTMGSQVELLRTRGIQISIYRK